MSTLNQAAIIIHSLPRPQSARILSQLEMSDIDDVLDAIDQIEELTAEEIALATGQFSAATGCSTRPIARQKRLEAAQVVDRRSTSGRAAHGTNFRADVGNSAVVESDSIDLDTRFGFIADASPLERTRLLRDEHPRNIAIVLAELPVGVASGIVNELEPVLRVSVLRRLCDTELPSDDDVTQLVYMLKLRYNKLVNQQFSRSGIECAANVISCTDPDTREVLIEQIRSSDPELACRLSQSIFNFDDLVMLDDAQIKMLLRQTDTSLWAPALKNATFETRKKVLHNMASVAGRVLSEEISLIGNVNEPVANRARREIVAQVLKLFTR